MNNIGPIMAALIAFGTLGYYVFQAIQNRRTGGPRSKISPLLGDEVGQRVAKTLKQPAGVDELIALLDECGTDFDARDFYVHELAPLASLERLNQLNETAPTATTLLARGVHFIDAAWRARGRGNADSVSKTQWQKFQELLDQARNDLEASAEAAPDDPTPLGQLMIALRGLDAPLEQSTETFEKAVAIQPDHYRAHWAMLTQLSPRWGGEPEDLTSFVSSAVQNAEVGSPLHMLIIGSHLDTWSDRLVIQKRKKAADQFLQNQAVCDEMVSAYEASLGAEAFEERKTSIYLRNQAAFAFFMFQRPELTQVELTKIGKAFTEYPWIYGRTGEEETEDVIERAKLITRHSLK